MAAHGPQAAAIKANLLAARLSAPAVLLAGMLWPGQIR